MKIAVRFCLPVIMTVLLLCVSAIASPESDFVRPPGAARPLVWWHWMYGNISKDGITADLESMAAVGVGGVQLFPEATLDVPAGPVRYHSPEWYEMMRHTIATAKR